jgi:hypothetical protein
MDRSHEIGDGPEEGQVAEKLVNRRDFLVGLKKWSKVVIGVSLLGGTVGGLLLENTDAFGSSWVNRGGGGGGGWINRPGGGGGWLNHAGGGGGWVNHFGGGGTWVNGGQGGWVNRFGGGGSWVNR